MKKSLLLFSVFVIIGCVKNNAPLCSIEKPAKDAVIEIGETVIISADASDSDGYIEEVRFFVDDIGEASVNEFPYEYHWNTGGLDSGEYTLKAEAIDNEGAASEVEISISLAVSGNIPVADFSSDITTAMEGDTIRFYDQTANNPQSWSWNFGDGEGSTDQNPEKVYNTAGTYTVSLEASNSYGANKVEKTDYIIIEEYCMGCKTGSVQDQDGNMYKTVQIGHQWWMAENLNTTHYSTGDAIHFYPDSTSFYKATGPGYTYYQYNEAMYGETYGALYNWWAAVDSRNVCPEGWHVPNAHDWEQLIQGLGGENIAGSALKSTGDEWLWGNEDATNASGFTGIPSGSTEGPNAGMFAGYWTTVEKDDNYAYYRELSNYTRYFWDKSIWKNIGFSIRCVKNSD